jgi:hypothetical protein
MIIGSAPSGVNSQCDDLLALGITLARGLCYTIPMPAQKKPASHRDEYIHLRVDAELKEQATEKARIYGGLSGVLRAMLKAFVGGERNFDPEDLASEHTQAPKRRKK